MGDTAAIFADSGVDDRLAQPSGACEEDWWKVSLSEEQFEIARLARIIMDAAPVDRNRRGRYEVAAEPDRANESILDTHQWHIPRCR